MMGTISIPLESKTGPNENRFAWVDSNSISKTNDDDDDDEDDEEFSNDNIKDQIFNNSINYSEGLHQDSLEYLSNKYESLNYDKTYNLIELNEKHTENSSVIFFEKYIFILVYEL